jgi:hypothetical protein
MSNWPKNEVNAKEIEESCLLLRNEWGQKELEVSAWAKQMVFFLYHSLRLQPGQHPHQFLLHPELVRWMDKRQACHQSA